MNKTKLNWKSQNKYNKHQRNAVNIQSNHPICPSFFSICTAFSLWCSSNEFYLCNKCVFQFVFFMTGSPFDICVPNLMAKNGFLASIVPQKILETHFKRIFLLETIFSPVWLKWPNVINISSVSLEKCTFSKAEKINRFLWLKYAQSKNIIIEYEM